MKHSNESHLFTDNENRRSAAELILNLFSHWGLSELLGYSPGSRTFLASLKENGIPDKRDKIDRVSYLLGIHKGLRINYPYNKEIVYGWVKSPNTKLGDQSPLTHMMLHGIPGMSRVRSIVDQERGR